MMPIASVCYSDDPDYPALAWCNWAGSAANVTSGPYRLSSTSYSSGVQFYIDCKMPTAAEIAEITEGKGTELRLTLGYGSKRGVHPLAFAGFKGGDVIQLVQGAF